MQRTDEQCHGRSRVETIGRGAEVNPNGRGILLPGLWAARLSMGLTQRALAGMVGMGQSGVHELETLARGAYPRTISKLCEALEVEPADLMCRIPTKAMTEGDSGE